MPILLVRPISDYGSTYNPSSLWTAVPSGDNYAVVDDVEADGDLTYSNAPSSQSNFLFNLPNIEVGTGHINSVTLYSSARRTNSGYARYAASIYTHNTTYINGHRYNIPYTYTLYSHTYTVNPHTSKPWNYIELADLKAGYFGVGDPGKGATYLYITQFYVEIDYSLTITEQNKYLVPFDKRAEIIAKETRAVKVPKKQRLEIIAEETRTAKMPKNSTQYTIKVYK